MDELEREKKLILDGRMSLEEAPKELIDHPVFQISQFIKEVFVGGKVSRLVEIEAHEYKFPSTLRVADVDQTGSVSQALALKQYSKLWCLNN